MQTFSSLLLTTALLDINQPQVHPFRLHWSSKAETPSWLRTASSAGILFNLNQTNSPVTFVLITNLHLCRSTVNPTYSLLIVKDSQKSELRPCKYDQTLLARCHLWMFVGLICVQTCSDVFPLISGVLTQGRHIQTQWSGPLVLFSAGYLSSLPWRGKPSGKRSAWKQRKPQNLHHDSQLLPSLRLSGSKLVSPCQTMPSRIKCSWHLVLFSSLL